MMAGVEQPWPERTRIEDLPVYLTEPAPVERFDRHRLAGAWSRAYRTASSRSQSRRGQYQPLEGRPPGTLNPWGENHSPVFDMMVPLQGRRVAAALEAWWPAEAKTGVVTVERRLKLWPPEGDGRSGWKMRGRLRRLTSLHWVPVVVELWEKYEGYMRITVTPQSRVLTSRRYYRLGNSVVDRMCEELATTPVDAKRARSGALRERSVDQCDLHRR
jgi:hypothetical protein